MRQAHLGVLSQAFALFLFALQRQAQACFCKIGTSKQLGQPISLLHKNGGLQQHTKHLSQVLMLCLDASQHRRLRSHDRWEDCMVCSMRKMQTDTKDADSVRWLVVRQ